MKRTRWICSGLLSLAACWGAAGPSAGEDDHHHDHERGVATFRKGFRLVDPRGQAVTDQVTFRFIIPLTRGFGAYYTHENKYYYTPAPPPSVRGGPVVLQRPIPIEFGARKHLHELAQRLERATNEFCLDLYYNHRRNPHFRETYREAYQLLQAAKFVHRSADDGDIDAIRRSVTSIDSLFHHVQEDVNDWRGEMRRPIGPYSLPEKVEELEALIHHLMYDLGIQPEHDHDHGTEDAPPPPEEEAPPPPRR